MTKSGTLQYKIYNNPESNKKLTTYEETKTDTEITDDKINTQETHFLRFIEILIYNILSWAIWLLDSIYIVNNNIQ